MRLPSFAKKTTDVCTLGEGGGGVMLALDASLSNLTRLPMLRRSFLRCRQIFVKLSSLMTFKKKTVEGSMNSALACEQASRGALAAGREKEGELATTSLELNSTSNFPVACLRLNCQISANQREAATNTNVNKHWKARAKDNDVTTNVISANHHFASTFSMQILKFQRRIFKLSFLFQPRRQSASESLHVG